MAVPYYGDFAEDDTVNLPFNTFSSNDPSASVTATELVAADIFVHKDGSATAITTDGATVDIDAPGVGAHMITIDTNADAAYVTGSEYAVRVNGMTVDGGLVNAWIGAFSIERAGGVLALLKGTNSLANIEDKIDIIDTNVDQIETAVITNAAGADISADILVIDNFVDGLEAKIDIIDTEVDKVVVATITNAAGVDVSADILVIDDFVDGIEAKVDTAITDIAAVKTETALIVADTNELQVDNVPGLIATAQADLDTITGTAGVLIGTDAANVTEISDAVWDEDATGHQTLGTFGQAIGDPVADATTIYQAVATDAAGDNVAVDVVAVKAETVLIVADTGELQSDDVPTLIAAVQSDTDDLQTQIGTAGAGLSDLGGMSTGMKAEVNTEVDGALDTAIPELTVAAPAATPTIRTGLMLLYMALRNKLVVQTSGTDALELHNDAGTKIASKLLTDDGSDYEEAEML